MNHRPLMTRDASDAPVATQAPCPLCAAGLIRIRCRTIDRLLSYSCSCTATAAPMVWAGGKAIFAYVAKR